MFHRLDSQVIVVCWVRFEFIGNRFRWRQPCEYTGSNMLTSSSKSYSWVYLSRQVAVASKIPNNLPGELPPALDSVPDVFDGPRRVGMQRVIAPPFTDLSDSLQVICKGSPLHATLVHIEHQVAGCSGRIRRRLHGASLVYRAQRCGSRASIKVARCTIVL